MATLERVAPVESGPKERGHCIPLPSCYLPVCITSVCVSQEVRGQGPSVAERLQDGVHVACVAEVSQPCEAVALRDRGQINGIPLHTRKWESHYIHGNGNHIQ